MLTLPAEPIGNVGTETGLTSDEAELSRPAVREESLDDRLGPGGFPGIRKPFRSVFWMLHIAFGTLCLVLMLAILAAVPGLNLLTLGYLLEPQKRVALSGRLRDGFPLLVLAPRLGIIVFFGLLFLVPIRVQALRVSDAAVVLGASDPAVLRMQLILQIAQAVVAIHLLLAISRGGTVGCFLRPIKNLRWFWSTFFTRRGRDEMARGISQVLNCVRPLHHFWIGVKGFFGAVGWLLIPTGLLVVYAAPNRATPVYGILSFLGVVLMIPVTAWLPMLQVHQVVSGRFLSIYTIRAARQIIRNAPISWMLTTVLLYAMTFPLYLTKIRLLPADALLVLTPFFIVLTYPARILIAWAYHRGMSKTKPAWFPVRWTARLAMIPLLAAYAGFLFLTPFVSELGKAAPLENQAFLSPVPYAQWGRADR